MTLIRFVFFVLFSAFPLNSNAENISAYALMGNPQSWNGKQVVVTGFLCRRQDEFVVFKFRIDEIPCKI